MSGVFTRLVGQDAVKAELLGAARAARGDAGHSDAGAGTMTHAWLITGPPGSGRSVAALCFAAALQCTADGEPGCGRCHACTTTLAGTHADVRRVVPEGLSIGVDGMRAIVQIAARRPATGNWQIVVIEDADRLTEGAANALLKVVEEPPPSTVFLLCAPSVDPEDVAITLRSRCRHVALVTPSTEAIARVLVDSDGLTPETADWAASVSGGHVGRARRLATDPEARQRRERALGLVRDAATPSRAYAAAEELVAAAEAEAVVLTAERAEAETEELRTALGAGGTGKGTAGAMRGAAGAIKDLERRQKSRQTRASRDALDRALIDLATYFRDALMASSGAGAVRANHPDMAERVAALAAHAPPERLLRCIEAVLECREALAVNVKPKFAVDAMVATIGQQLG
ncbi:MULTISPECIES: DNA polymerase III subunit delta' [Mycobacterium avium complex (MAC)]|uniref:DNA polymerase III subunit delta' n=3 Tax=Mycobacterium avium complex (MAC) TaxID=120793 RepID=A0AAW5S345_MYCBC|nr:MULTISPECIES: DNA polymerase III subunit delta' [Mycobacterium avium complex (MAC)]ETA91177.1 DNA polymerase III subunit delta' [Mycobacterium avium 05-4293]TXA40935.1 DNA polymerase III subunit delta' [Mycobacterium tuberculosis variant bovis]KDP08869.1 DNA polymerase III subunit delta' [Mycobacterium avium subsp. hominissuis 101]MBZ4499653.1 DNA polymerase III subunit delta' [Mycobacterium avium subsp. hominissuis]MBZ4504951.1 DNA polymerase III subunit delta' [Mycobacterium avium subsp. 